ncbi:hypothetical protein Sste5346_006231 [Sporothrix stenoceras]|uniref:Zn(2)-C6 fungal-type domain-containing protein n=1 Tax=Sporothrix stenoceras TaxID=5173 RepID=A0ABR3Z0Z3_9PEZI
MANSTASPSSPPPPRPPSPRQPYACVICCERKVKCDKRQPCLSCTKSGLHCRYRPSPPPPRRKKRTFPEQEPVETSSDSEALLRRLRPYEAILRGAGISLDNIEDVRMRVGSEATTTTATTATSTSTATPAEFNGSTVTVDEDKQDDRGDQDQDESQDVVLFPRRRGILLAEHGGTRYYEHGLIGGLGQKYRQRPLGRDKQDGNSLANLNLLFGPLPMAHPGGLSSGLSSGLSGLPTDTALRLWTVFLENVHPLTMVLHAPTVQRALFPEYQDYNPPRSSHALRLAVYACAVASLTDTDCRQQVGQPRDGLLADLQQAVQAALHDATFPRTPDMDLLRAYVLLMTSMFSNTDSTSLFVMMGVAMRMAQLQGLHRDGAALRLSLYETELRRRLWWYIVSLDSRLSEVLGSESTLPRSCDTRLPSNINDASFERGTTDLPEVAGASDMVFCLLKYETVRFLQERDPRTSTVPEEGAGSGQRSHTHVTHATHASRAPRMRSVGALERLLEERFLRFCDPLVPLHLLTTTVARSSICKFRHMEQRGQAHTHAHASPGEQATNRRILQMAARNVAYDNLLHTTASLGGFLWNVHFFFPWGAPIFILRIMGTARTAAEWDDDMQAAWAHILELHRNHPEFAVRDAHRIEHLLVADLTLEAWHTREQAMSMAMAGTPRTVPQQQPIPAVILALQEAKRGTEKEATEANLSKGSNEPSVTMPVDLATTTHAVYPNMAMSGMDAAFANGGFALNSVNTVSSVNSVNTVNSALSSIDWTDWGSY